VAPLRRTHRRASESVRPYVVRSTRRTCTGPNERIRPCPTQCPCA